MVYAAYSIGYSFNKRKELWTVILILVFFQLAQFTAIAMIGLFIHTWISLDANTLPTGIELLLLWGMLGELLFCAIGYAVTWYFTTKKTESRVTRFRKSSRERSPLFRLLFCALLSAKFPQGRKLCQPSASNSLV